MEDHNKNSLVECPSCNCPPNQPCCFKPQPCPKTCDQICSQICDTNPHRKETILTTAINHYGPHNQILKTMEEAGELVRALARLSLAINLEEKDTQAVYDNVAEEIADMEIMLAQMRIIIPGIHRDIETTKEAKLIRLEKKLREGKGNE